METDKQGGVLVTGAGLYREIGGETFTVSWRSGDFNRRDAGEHGVRRSRVRHYGSPRRWRRLFRRQRIDGIVHLAAVLPTAAQREPLLATKINIQGSVNLMEMARQFEVSRFLFGSSLSVYGTCPADQVVTEMDRVAPEDLYGAAKLYVEQLGEAYRHTHGLEFVSLRIGRVVGPGARSATSAWRSEIFECLEKAGPAEIDIPYADSERILLVHVEDVATMLLQLLQAPRLAHGFITPLASR